MFDRVLVDQVAAAAADLDACTDGELSEALLACDRLRSQLFAAEARITARWDARQVWAADGALSGGQWLAHRGESSRVACASQVRRARHLTVMPLTTAALETGQIGAAKAIVLADARRPVMAGRFSEAEAELVEHAKQFTVEGAARIVRRWVEVTRPDDEPGADVKGRTMAHLSLSDTFDGAMVINGILDVEWAAIVRRGIDDLCTELRPSPSDAAAADGPVRSPGHRRAEALVELVRRGIAAGPGSTPARPEIVAIVDADVLNRPHTARDQFTDVCQLDTGTPITGTTARRLACDANITTLIIGADGSLLDAHPARRTATRTQRRALGARDGGCTFPGCDRPADWTEAHHLVFYEHHGPTTTANLCLLCPRHHHLIHETGFTVTRHPDHTLHFHRPDTTEIPNGRPSSPPLRPKPSRPPPTNPAGRPSPTGVRPRAHPVS